MFQSYIHRSRNKKLAEEHVSQKKKKSSVKQTVLWLGFAA